MAVKIDVVRSTTARELLNLSSLRRVIAESVEKPNPQLWAVQMASFEKAPIGRFFDRL